MQLAWVQPAGFCVQRLTSGFYHVLHSMTRLWLRIAITDNIGEGGKQLLHCRGNVSNGGGQGSAVTGNTGRRQQLQRMCILYAAAGSKNSSAETKLEPNRAPGWNNCVVWACEVGCSGGRVATERHNTHSGHGINEICPTGALFLQKNQFADSSQLPEPLAASLFPGQSQDGRHREAHAPKLL
jgi:hypothetical protein